MEPLVHVVVPFVALTLWGCRFKVAFPLSLLGLLPDLDALFLVHRSFSHSLVVLAAVAVPLWWAVQRFRPRFSRMVWLGFLCVASHLILDMFTGYTPLFWPVYNLSVWIHAELGVHIGSSFGFQGETYVGTEPVSFRLWDAFDAPLFTGRGLVLSAVLLTPLVVKWLRGQWKSWEARKT